MNVRYKLCVFAAFAGLVLTACGGGMQDLEQYIADNDLPAMSGAVVEKDGRRFYALLAGIYTDRETAERATRSLPEALSAHGPWVRSMESLQAAMARAEQLPAES